jgi:hypothetical protein
MMNQLLLMIFGLFLGTGGDEYHNQVATDNDPINDGPYIYQVNNRLKAGWIENGIYRENFIVPENFERLCRDFNLSFTYKDLSDTYLLKPEFNQSFSNADSIAVISDIHGEYGIYIDLLKGTGIIDNNLNWKFGKGHLVVLGDMFDRGNMVTEILWHLFGLEKQAEKAGGSVHVVLGNHEFMVLRNELCEINEKYSKVEKASNTTYADLFSANSVLGKWLRTKPVVMTIDNIIFVHGGISTAMLHKSLSIKQINRIFTRKVIGRNLGEACNNKLVKFLNEADGPLWYRGYFYDTNFSESDVDAILDFYGKGHIIVGHTPNKETKSLFNNKILGADAGIMYDMPGEMIIYKEGSFYQSLGTGERIKL